MNEPLDLAAMATGLGGGLALFLYGMRKMADALKTAAGTGLKDVLARLTTNRFTGALSGAVITAVMQSSSVTTVMVVGFVSAGLMTFTQSVGVIMGANIGSTVTAQIVAFNIAEYSLALIAIGFPIELLVRSRRVRYYGIAMMGMGFLFFGMDLMGDAMAPLRSYEPFIAFMQEMRAPWLGILAGFAFTAVVQSSAATAGLVIVLSTQGLITLEQGIALLLGANVGTCVTAGLSAIGRPREAVKAAVVHVVFNVVGVLLVVWFIPPFADLVRSVSPGAPEISEAARRAAEVPRQIANAHTIFNVGSTLILIGFAGRLAALVDRIVPGPKTAGPSESAAVYLDRVYLEQPAVALDRVRLELSRVAVLATRMMDRALPTALAGTQSELRVLSEKDRSIDELHGAIVEYLGQLSKRELVDPLPRRLQEYFGIANYLENAGDTVAKGLVSLGHRRLAAAVVFDTATTATLERLARSAIGSFAQATDAFERRDLKLAKQVVESRASMSRRANEARGQLVRLVADGEQKGITAYRLAVEHVDELKQIDTLARRIAAVILDAHPAEGPSPGAVPVGDD